MDTETVSIGAGADGFFCIQVHRLNESGVEYNSELFFQAMDLAKIADAFDTCATRGGSVKVSLIDGQLSVFSRFNMLGMELHREEHLPHGGYDTMDMTFQSAKQASAALRNESP